MTEDYAVVVGIDEPRANARVIQWAAEHAKGAGRPLQVCHVVEEDDRRDGRAQQLVDETVAEVRRDFPDLTVSGTVRHGPPARTLVEMSAAASMVVLGCRGSGGFTGLMVGSVAAQVAAHASCPVAVVRGTATRTPDVVVGVDGSPGAETALRLAVAEARRTGGTLVVVHAYRLPPLPAAYAPNPGVDLDAHREAAQALLDRAVAAAEKLAPELKVSGRVWPGSAAVTLLDTSVGASAVVVGSRGVGGLPGLLLGSVGQQLVAHADCPVLIAR